MKQNLLFFALGLLLTIAISSTTISMMTIKPAKPTAVVAFYGDADVTQSKILKYTREGYIVKSLSMASSGSSVITGYRTVFVVMERY